MASASPLKDIEDKYFECSYCLENFNEPKLLPCVHRYCRDCLKQIIGKCNDDFNCPLCNYLCTIPLEGVDGFRTDFHMKSMLQYIQLQQSAKTEEITEECAGCSKEAIITSYCFKCIGFLCDQCYQLHLTLKMMREHKPSVLSLKEITDQKLTLERLASVTETPRCHVHVNKAAEISCGTCSNLPICMVCGHHGEHKGHTLHEVKLFARQERGKIGKTLATIEKHKENVHQLPIKVEKAKRKLSENISATKEKLQLQYVKETEKIGKQLQETDDLLEMNKTDIDDIEKQELMDLEKERAKETDTAVKKINDKYDKLMNEKKTKNKNLRDGQENLYGEKRAKINRKLGFIDKEFKDLSKFINMQGDQKAAEMGKISKDANNRKRRFDNFRSSVSIILASQNDWTDAQCLPEISTASDSLIEDVKRDYPELESLAHITVSDLPSVTADTVTITEQVESVIDIEGIKAKGWLVVNMAITDNGSIVITGDVDDRHTHITVINKQGNVIHQEKQTNCNVNVKRNAYFCSLSDLTLFKVATTCRDSEVGIYDTQNGTYIKKDISDIISSWREGLFVTCVATDRINKNIFVGSNSKNVFILDDKLNYCHTFRLPWIIQYSCDIITHDGTLIVCDTKSNIACIVSIEGHEANKLLCELPRPDHEGGAWRPARVCTDSNGFIYVLWFTKISGQRRKIITQYSQDGRHLLITRPVDASAADITTAITGDTENLLLATISTGKLYTYRLKMN